MKSRIAYTKPSITELEVEYATDAARNGWGPRCYEYIGKFEEAFANHLGVKHAIATSSCTGAIHMGLSALGIGPGDEVILADTNWTATVAPVVHLGARPVFVDILSDSWCIDPALAEVAITPQTKAIIAVHLYGNLADMDALLEIGARYNIPVIEDAAEAIGSTICGKRAGSMGKFGTFSFHGTKTLTTGEGGMFVTNDTALYDQFMTLSNHGRASSQSKQFWPDIIGFKYKMSNIQAAIGCAQMERIGALIARKQEIMSYYRKALEPFSALSLNPEPEGMIIGAWMPNAVFDESTGVTREPLCKAFEAEEVDARVFFYPLSSTPAFEDRPENTVARSIARRSINLPSFHDMSDGDQNRVIDVIKAILH